MMCKRSLSRNNSSLELKNGFASALMKREVARRAVGKVLLTIAISISRAKYKFSNSYLAVEKIYPLVDHITYLLGEIQEAKWQGSLRVRHGGCGAHGVSNSNP